jgi:hypothetical protein
MGRREERWSTSNTHAMARDGASKKRHAKEHECPNDL